MYFFSFISKYFTGSKLGSLGFSESDVWKGAWLYTSTLMYTHTDVHLLMYQMLIRYIKYYFSGSVSMYDQWHTFTLEP